jgi:mono/diheme cytochrome c family protein
MEGKLTLTRKGCITCHSVWGVGGKLGPDLATAGQDQSFQQLASMFWNHTPRMVQLLKQKGSEWPVLSEKEMADIISFIYYLKLLDRPGDPAIGKTIFQEQKCSRCHSLTEPPLPLARFGAYVAPVFLAQAMWNAGQTMQRVQREQGIAMPLFKGREIADLQAYIRSARSSPDSGSLYLPLPDISRGATLFRSKGCARCHQNGGGHQTGPDLSKTPLRKSISEICGILWNHSFAMQARMTARGVEFPRLEGNELGDILAYIYFLHFSRDEGDAARGEKVFTGKGCTNCHGGGGSKKQGPDLVASNQDYSMLRLATSMWNHAPIMYGYMESEVMKWIKLDLDDMQDLAKFLRRAGEKKHP